MWISDLTKCLLIICYFEIITIAADDNWQYFKLKDRRFIKFDEKYLKVNRLNSVLNQSSVKSAQSDSVLDRDVAGYDFTDEEIQKLKLWPRGVIPYYIDKLSYDKVFRDKIRVFLENVNEMTSLQFLELNSPPPDDETRFVMFMNRRATDEEQHYSPLHFSNVGAQRVKLRYDCFTNGDIYAAILAVVGVPPQHCAPNRDKYIEVNIDNVLPEKQEAFDILNDDQWVFHDLDYDFQSAGHFDSHKYTANGQATIEPRIKDVTIIPHIKREFSNKDILKMRYLYNYIVNNKAPLSESGCKKMFKLGTGLQNNEPLKEKLRGTARNKPNKFLGLPEEKSAENQPEENDDNEGNPNDKPSDTLPEENSKNEEVTNSNEVPLEDQSKKNPNNKLSDSLPEENSKNEENSNPNKVPLEEKPKDDTDEEQET